MIPYNYGSNSPARAGPQNPGWMIPPPNSPGVSSSNGEGRARIQVNSTIDADIVLRRVIEDRAAILALKSKAATNEAELNKAKTRQMNIAKILDQQDREIAHLSTKAKRDLAEYNANSREYIKAFLIAFEKGDLDILPHHPSLPSLEELDLALHRRKATLIEKVQCDDRVKKLAYISSQERVTTKVIKRNEEAFLRAVDIAKQQFGASCEAWLDRAHALLAAAPHHAHKFGPVKKRAVEIPVQVQPLQKGTVGAAYPQCPQRAFAGVPLPQGQGFVIPESPEARPKRSLISSVQPVSPVPQPPGLASKRQKMDHTPTPPPSPVNASPIVDPGAAEQQSAIPEVVVEDASPKEATTPDQDMEEALSIAQVLANLQGDMFAVANI